MGILWWRRRPQAVGGAEARDRAERALEDELERKARIDRVVDSINELRQSNHFSEKIEHLIRTGGRG